MNKTIFMFRTVTLRPHWFQYIINETGSLCLLVASIWIYKFCSFAYHEWAIYACILLLFHLLFKLVSCKNGIYHHRRTNHYPSWGVLPLH